VTTCPYVITAPGSYYVANDLTDCANGITVLASNVGLYFDGHTISGFGLGSGVQVVGQSAVWIQGPGTVTRFTSGVDFEGATYSGVGAMTSTSNFFGYNVNANFTGGQPGVYSSHDLYLGDRATGNNQHGFTLNGASDDLFSGDNSSQNGRQGFLLYVSNHINLYYNTADNNGQDGVDVNGGATSNTISHNHATGNGSFDLEDDNPGCDANTWMDNVFNKANQPCIH